MTKWKIFFRINRENKGPHILSKGLPQGCILSPILYMIYINHIHKVINCNVVNYVKFFYFDRQRQDRAQATFFI